jgi:hypothetical protein
MTLICTVISNAGIVQASDSNITRNGTGTRSGKKVFKLPYIHSALAFAGRYSVGGQKMDLWMPDFISSYGRRNDATLLGFCETLRETLSNEMTREEKRSATLIHVAGYVDGGEGSHPEMHFVRNAATIDPVSGDYSGMSDDFTRTEDFWERDYPQVQPGSFQLVDGYRRYFNGTAPGRIAFIGANQMLTGLFKQVWSNPNWKFRAPRTLEETAAFVKLEVGAVSTLYSCSDYPVPFVGGEVQIETLVPPPGAVTL